MRSPRSLRGAVAFRDGSEPLFRQGGLGLFPFPGLCKSEKRTHRCALHAYGYLILLVMLQTFRKPARSDPPGGPGGG